MKVTYDPRKNVINRAKHGLDFQDVGALDWDGAWFEQDIRWDYGEDRFVAYILEEDRLYIVCFTVRGDVIRVISFRKGNAREKKYYEQKTSDE